MAEDAGEDVLDAVIERERRRRAEEVGRWRASIANLESIWGGWVFDVGRKEVSQRMTRALRRETLVDFTDEQAVAEYERSLKVVLDFEDRVGVASAREWLTEREDPAPGAAGVAE